MAIYNYKKLIPVLLIGIVGISSFSCIHQVANKPCPTNPDSVFFSRDIIPLLNANCNTIGCHSGGNPAGKLNLEASKAYTSLKKSGSGYIDTLDSKNSIIYIQMSSSSQPMPPTGKLSDCKIDLVLKWIEQGAKNN